MSEVVCCLQITVHSPGQRAPFNTETLTIEVDHDAVESVADVGKVI